MVVRLRASPLLREAAGGWQPEQHQAKRAQDEPRADAAHGWTSHGALLGGENGRLVAVAAGVTGPDGAMNGGFVTVGGATSGGSWTGADLIVDGDGDATSAVAVTVADRLGGRNGTFVAVGVG